MTKELILLNLETVRIKRFDDENVIVQVLTEMEEKTFRNPSTGEPFTKPKRSEWVDKGYYSNVKSALRNIYNDDLLIEDKERTLAEYIAINKEVLSKLTKWGL